MARLPGGVMVRLHRAAYLLRSCPPPPLLVFFGWTLQIQRASQRLPKTRLRCTEKPPPRDGRRRAPLTGASLPVLVSLCSPCTAFPVLDMSCVQVQMPADDPAASAYPCLGAIPGDHLVGRSNGAL